MDKMAFMQELEYRLRHLTDEDKYDALEYYSEYIDDLNLMPGEDVCSRIGTPKEVAQIIIDQTTERRIDEQQEKNTTKGSAKILWLSILGIFASPIALPIAILLIVLLFVGIIVAGSILISFYCTGGSLIAAGGFSIIAGFSAGSLANRLVVIGAGIILIGLGLMAIVGTVKLTQLLVRGISAAVKHSISRRRSRTAMTQQNTY
ncbi:MAG: DUF1700 domain-containing protein [Lachnospiraceae bacterium]|nr:DUF1700 domain-containing protein [Lachnospiraceae bacterium]